ncbi:unnamed protein product [Gadus morhua 'NCC']
MGQPGWKPVLTQPLGPDGEALCFHTQVLSKENPAEEAPVWRKTTVKTIHKPHVPPVVYHALGREGCHTSRLHRDVLHGVERRGRHLLGGEGELTGAEHSASQKLLSEASRKKGLPSSIGRGMGRHGVARCRGCAERKGQAPGTPPSPGNRGPRRAPGGGNTLGWLSESVHVLTGGSVGGDAGRAEVRSSTLVCVGRKGLGSFSRASPACFNAKSSQSDREPRSHAYQPNSTLSDWPSTAPRTPP